MKDGSEIIKKSSITTKHDLKDLKNKSGIYKLSNKIDNRIYIGSTGNLFLRFCQYSNNVKKPNDYGLSVSLSKFVNTYGQNQFIFEIIEYVEDKNKLIEREKFYLDELQPFGENGFNVCKKPLASGAKDRLVIK